MSMVVGHNCPGCGLDAPAVACAACGETVIWTPDTGSHCGACGHPASTFTCAECGLSAELDKRQGDQRVERAVDSGTPASEPERPPQRWLPAMRVAASAGWRALVVILLLGAPVIVISTLPASEEDLQAGRAPRDLTAKPAIAQTDLLPVPVQPAPQVSSLPVRDPPPPTVYVLDTPPAAPAPQAAPIPQVQSNDNWLRRVFRTGRGQSWNPPERHLP